MSDTDDDSLSLSIFLFHSFTLPLSLSIHLASLRPRTHFTPIHPVQNEESTSLNTTHHYDSLPMVS